jgi:hypothetical protein
LYRSSIVGTPATAPPALLAALEGAAALEAAAGDPAAAEEAAGVDDEVAPPHAAVTRSVTLAPSVSIQRRDEGLITWPSFGL